MPLLIVRDNIVHMKTDAIVNAANAKLKAGGGVCGSIFDKAGTKKMKQACKEIGGCAVGNAVITPGFELPAKYVIHAVGPIWKGGKHGEEELLRSCYQASLTLALEYHLESIAFPLISSGIYGYPKDQALQVAVSAISEFVLKYEMNVYLVVYDRESFQLSEQLLSKVESYIDDRYVDSRKEYRHLQSQLLEEDFAYSNRGVSSAEVPRDNFNRLTKKSMGTDALQVSFGEPVQKAVYPQETAKPRRKLSDLLAQTEETFSESLLRLIDESGKKDSEVYNRANIDRRLFSKIRANKDYRPSKATVIAFCIALELSLDETCDLLAKAGYVLTHTSKADIIVEYFIESENYNIFEINEVLFEFNQPILGSF